MCPHITVGFFDLTKTIYTSMFRVIKFSSQQYIYMVKPSNDSHFTFWWWWWELVPTLFQVEMIHCTCSIFVGSRITQEIPILLLSSDLPLTDKVFSHIGQMVNLKFKPNETCSESQQSNRTGPPYANAGNPEKGLFPRHPLYLLPSGVDIWECRYVCTGQVCPN